ARVRQSEGAGHARGHGGPRRRRAGHADELVRAALCRRRGSLDGPEEPLRQATSGASRSGRGRAPARRRGPLPRGGVMQPFQRTAAVFDIDDSLLDGNAGTIFTWFLYSNREMVPSVRSQVPRALYEYARKRLSEADMVALGSRSQQGIRADKLRELARRCFDRHVKKRVTQHGLRTVRRHLLQGNLVIVAS